MSKRGYFSLAALVIAVIVFVKFSQEPSFILLIAGVAAVSVAAIVLFTGIFPKDEIEHIRPHRALNRVISPEHTVIIREVEDEYLASTNIPKPSPEWEGQG